VELRELQWFVALAGELHFGRTAAKLQTDPSTLSRQIRALERELGLPLFVRTTRRVGLTSAGAALLDHAEQVLRDATALRSVATAIAAGQRGEVRAAYAGGTGEDAAALVRAMRDTLPELDVHLEQSTSVGVARAVHEGRATFGVSYLPPPAELTGLESLVLSTDAIGYVALPLGHRLSARGMIWIRDLDGESVIAPPVAVQPAISYLDDGDFRSISIRIVRASTFTEDALLDLVAAGYGVFVCTRSSAKRYRRRDVVIRRLMGDLPQAHEYLLWRESDGSHLLRSIISIARSLHAETDRPQRSAS
jgi:DNA-binding transcriptional LysR family regulator